MNKRFVSIVLITNIVFSCYSTAKEEIRTNQNNQTDLFAKEIDNKQELEQSLKHAKEQAGKGIAEQEGLKSLNVTQDEVNNKTTELNSINAYDLESAGRSQRAKEENHYYELLEVDHSAPGMIKHKQDMEQIANASGKLIAKLTQGLKEIGVNCKKTKGNKEVEPQYVIDTEQELSSDITYTKVICEQPRNAYDCTQSLNVSCGQMGDCNSGGISLSGISNGDIKWEYSYPNLTIGKLENQQNWPGYCSTFDRSVNFQIRNKDEITEFRLVQVGFSDWLWIKINGNTIYVGPKGGNYIEGFINNGLPTVKNGQGSYDCLKSNAQCYNVWGGGVYTKCDDKHARHNMAHLRTEYAQQSSNLNLSTDLKPYLKTGLNEIWMRVVVGRTGFGWMKIIAKQKCCHQWQDKWSEQCQIN